LLFCITTINYSTIFGAGFEDICIFGSLNTGGGRRCFHFLEIRPNLQSPAYGLGLAASAPPRLSAKLAGGIRDSCVCIELLHYSQDLTCQSTRNSCKNPHRSSTTATRRVGRTLSTSVCSQPPTHHHHLPKIAPRSFQGRTVLPHLPDLLKSRGILFALRAQMRR
jgi:hypothetical protein